MQFSIPQSVLAKSLALVGRAVSSRPSQPVLSAILLSADHDRQTVTFTGFDLSLSIRTTEMVDVIAGGSIAVPAKLFSDIINKLSEDVSISIKKTQVLITSGSASFTINSFHPGEYPVLPTIKGDELAIPGELLLSGLSVGFASGSDETKRVLCGVNIKSGEGSIAFAATNGHRLAAYTDSSDLEIPSLNIPVGAVKAIEKLIKPSEEIFLRYEQEMLLVQSGNTILTTRLLEGSYPNYPALIPTVFGLNVTVARKPLLSALDRVALVAEAKNNVLEVEIFYDNISLSAGDTEIGSGIEYVKTDVIIGDGFKLAFNLKYLRDALQNIPTDTVEIKLNTPTTLVLINAMGYPLVTLIMPVQIRK